jgi:hypothetical protein
MLGKIPLLLVQQIFNGVGSNGQKVRYQVANFQDIYNVIIPPFMAYPLQSMKAIDFFCLENVC